MVKNLSTQGNAREENRGLSKNDQTWKLVLIRPESIDENFLV